MDGGHKLSDIPILNVSKLANIVIIIIAVVVAADLDGIGRRPLTSSLKQSTYSTNSRLLSPVALNL